MGSENWTLENLAWMAGFYEGEGTFGCRWGTQRGGGSYYTELYLAISQNHKDVLETFHQMAGVGTIVGPYQRASGNDYWVFRCSTRHSYALIVALWPWLHSYRRQQATTALKEWIRKGKK